MLDRLVRLRDGYATYPSVDLPGRRRLVTDTRQWLHELRLRLEPSAPMAPPRAASISGVLFRNSDAAKGAHP